MTLFRRHSALALSTFAALIALVAPRGAAAAEGNPDAGAAPGAADPLADMEAAVLAAPPPGSVAPPPAPPPRAQAPARPAPEIRRRSNERPRASEPGEGGESGEGGEATEDQSVALAIGLSTEGFASGALQGGVFVGARVPGGLLVGGAIDFQSNSLEVPGSTQAQSLSSAGNAVRLGVAAQYAFLHSNDRRLDLVAAAELAYLSISAEGTVGAGAAEKVSASGFSLGVGPGLRFWVHPQIALGYVALLRYTGLSGDEAIVRPGSTGENTGASTGEVRFAGAFQILGVF